MLTGCCARPASHPQETGERRRDEESLDESKRSLMKWKSIVKVVDHLTVAPYPWLSLTG